MVIPMFCILQKNISELNTSNVLSNKFKSAILSQCVKRFGSVENVSILGMATVLDLRFKKVYFKDSVALSKTLMYVSNEMKQIQLINENSSDNDTITGMLI